MSWTPNTSLQFATSGTPTVSVCSATATANAGAPATISLIPQPIIQMPAGAMLQMPQMNFAPSAPTTGQIVQFIQTPNVPTQLLAASAAVKASSISPNASLSHQSMLPAMLSASAAGTMLSASLNGTNGSNTCSVGSRSNKQILPKPSGKAGSGKATSVQGANTISSSNCVASMATTLCTSTAQATMNTSLAGSQLTGSQIMFSNGQTGFLTSNGTILLSGPQPLQTIGAPTQQPILIQGSLGGQIATGSGTMQLALAKSQTAPILTSTGTLMKSASISDSTNVSSSQPNKLQNQTIIIPASSSPSSTSVLGTQQAKLPQQQLILTAPTPAPAPAPPQFLQIQTANGPMLVALQGGQATTAPTVASNPADLGQTILQTLQSAGAPGQQLQLISSGPTDQGQPTLSHTFSAGSLILTQPTQLYTTSNAQIGTMTNTSSMNMTTSITTAAVPKAKGTRKKATNKNKEKDKPPASNSPRPASKGVNLAELLKETGIIEESPPNSPQFTGTSGGDESVRDNGVIGVNNVEMNEQPQPTISLTPANCPPLQLQPNAASGTLTLTQPTMLMTSGAPASAASASNYYLAPFAQPQPPTQLKLALAADGSVILQPVTQFAQPSAPANSTVTGNKDGGNSSQPSPDSTTPALDALVPSSVTLPSTSTITFTTNSLNTGATYAPAPAIKLSDSISLTIQNSNNMLDDKKLSQNTTVFPVVNNTGKASKAKRKDGKRLTKKQQQQANAQANQQQMITIPIQTALNSTTITPVMSASQPSISIGSSPMIQISSDSKCAGGKSDLPVVQISLNNHEFLERLETQIKTLSQLKSPSEQQRTLLQELMSLQKTMQDAKAAGNDGSGNEAKIILTSQPLMSQPNASSVPNEITIQSTPSKPLNHKQSAKDAHKQSITITSKPIESSMSITPKLEAGKVCGSNISASQLMPTPQLIIGGKTSSDSETAQIQMLGGDQSSSSVAPSGATIQVVNQIITITTPAKSSPYPLAAGQLNRAKEGYSLIHSQGKAMASGIKLKDGIPTNVGPNTTQVIIETGNDKVNNFTKVQPKSKFSFQQQLIADQAAASKPDIRNPFRNRNDACKRLLRYHVFYQDDVKPEKKEKFDQDFEVLAHHLLYKKQQLMRRFQLHLLNLSTKLNSTSEDIMLQKMFIESETTSLREDKQMVAQGIPLNLPSAPLHWQASIQAELDREEEEKLAALNRKRKSSEMVDECTFTQAVFKKCDPPSLQADTEEDEEESEEDEDEEEEEELNEDSNDDFSKYLNSVTDMASIDDLNTLYPNSTYGQLMSGSAVVQQSMAAPTLMMSSSGNHHTSHQANMSGPSQNTQTPYMYGDANTSWRPKDTFVCAETNDPMGNKSNTGTTSWNSAFVESEDAVAVESILGGQTSSTSPVGNLDLSGLSNIPGMEDDEQEDDEDDDNDDDDEDVHANGSALMYDTKNVSNVPSLDSQVVMQSQHMANELSNDMQMESAINSILDILVPSQASSTSQVQMVHASGPAIVTRGHPNQEPTFEQYTHSVISAVPTVSGGQGYSVPAGSGPSSYIGPSNMQSIMNQRQPMVMQDFGNDAGLDEAVKSILS